MSATLEDMKALTDDSLVALASDDPLLAWEAEPSPLDRLFPVTVLRDLSGRTVQSYETTVRQLADKSAKIRKSRKEDLPLTCMVTFGEIRSEKGSLRHDANVQTVEAITLDLDNGQLSVDDAVLAAIYAGCAVFISTTSSHAPEKPKLRVIAPLSRPTSPGEYEKLTARLNGVFEGNAAPESFALSQSFYAGVPESASPHYQAELIDGQAIDLMSHLDEKAVLPAKAAKVKLDAPTAALSKTSDPAEMAEAQRRRDEIEARLSAAADGQKHATLRNETVLLGGILHGLQWSAEEAAAWAVGCLPSAADQELALNTALSGIALGMQHPIPLSAAAEFALAGVLDPEPTNDNPPATVKRRLLSIDDVETMPDAEWIVAGLVQARTLAIVCGPPKHGKTFIALSMALHIAAGREFFGRSVQQGGVVYIAGEGAGGLKLRVRAARQEYGIPPGVPFWVLPRAVNFSDARAVDDLVATIRAETKGTIALVVIDTLARAMPATDENSAGEIGKVIAACDRLKEALSCVVMPIHHQGKDRDKGMRGSSALDGAVDTLLKATRDQSVSGADVVTLATVYQKDAEEAPPILFDLTKVDVAPGRGSLVPTLRTAPSPAAEKLTTAQRGVLRVLEGMLFEHSEGESAGYVHEATLVDVCAAGTEVSAAAAPRNRAVEARKAIKALIAVGRIQREGTALPGGQIAEEGATIRLATCH